MDEFFALVFKSIKADPDNGRVMAFIRRIIQMSTLNEAAFSAACLLIISELIKVKDDLKFQLFSFDQIANINSTRTKGKHDEDEDSEEEHFVDADKVKSQLSA